MKTFSSNARVVAVITAVVLVGGGASVAAADQITGGQIAKDTVKSRNIKDGTLKTKDLSAQARADLAGAKGATGAQGPQGPQGVPGIPGAGAAGTVIVANVTTSSQSGLVPVPAEDSSTFTSTRGVVLVTTPQLPAGRYIVSGTALFYALDDTVQYGEARLFSADGTAQGSGIFSPAIPSVSLGGVGAQTGASVEVNLTAPTTLTFRARVRGGTAGASQKLGGANLLITKAAPAA